MDAAVRSTVMMAIIFVVAQLGAVFMISSSVLGPEDRAFSNPNDPLIPIIYIGVIVLFTLAVLYIIRKKREDIIRFIFLGAVAFTIFYVLMAIALRFTVTVLALIVPIALTALLVYYLVKKPEWYVVDASGILMAIGVIGIFGISLNILPVFVLLIVLAVYDAISVYGTKHMVSLADGVTQMKLPILLVIPKRAGYSYMEQKPLKQQLEEKEEREAMFMGLGDVIIPGVLVASAYSFLSPQGDGNLLVSMGTLVGSIIGFAVLMRFVLKGNPQAGLPLLNGGAIIGYLVSYLLVFKDLSFGLSPW